MTNVNVFGIRISEVLARTGLSKEVERELRGGVHVKRGEDWDLVRNAVHYSEAGIVRLMELAGVVSSELRVVNGDGAQLTSSCVRWGDLPVLLVVAVNGDLVRNTNVVRCVPKMPNDEMSNDKREILVRVRSNVNFLRGMLIWGRRSSGGSAWEFLGRGDGGRGWTSVPVCPRGRGRW